MDYWDTVMQDDVYLIAAAGWVEAATPRAVVDDRERRIKETADLAIKRKKYKMDVIPPALIVARWFTSEQANIENLRGTHESAASKLEDFVDEHSTSTGGEDGVLMGIANGLGRITKAAATGRLKTIRHEPEGDEEQDILMRCLELIDAESRAGKAVREAQAALARAVLDRYAALTAAEIKALVVEDKWCASIKAAIADALQRLTQLLAGRVRQLTQRYARPLSEIEIEVEELTTKPPPISHAWGCHTHARSIPDSKQCPLHVEYEPDARLQRLKMDDGLSGRRCGYHYGSIASFQYH